MSGNFDFPPASSTSNSNNDSNADGTSTSITQEQLDRIRARIQTIRSFDEEVLTSLNDPSLEEADESLPTTTTTSEQLERIRTHNRLVRSELRERLDRVHHRVEALLDPRSYVSSSAAMPPLNRRHRQSSGGSLRPPTSHRSNVSNPNTSTSPPPPPTTDPPVSDVRRRPRATPSERYSALRRPRQQRERESATISNVSEYERQRNSSLEDLEHASQRLAEIGAEMSQLMDPPSLDFGSLSRGPTASLRDISQITGGDTEAGSRRRHKRRKLDNDAPSPSLFGHKYGHYGQVVPGNLKMQIVSCDGGEFLNKDGLYGARNLLKDDGDVYCSEKNTCNLILQHQGQTTFCITQVVIKTPRREYTCPCQEGLVFVSMSREALEQGTSNYQMNYSSEASQSEHSASSAGNELLSFNESLRDPIIERHRRRSTRNREREQQRENETEGRPFESFFFNVMRRGGRYRGPPGGPGDPDLGERPPSRFRSQRSLRPNSRPEASSNDADESCDWPLVDPTNNSTTPPPPFTVETDPADSASDGEMADDSPEIRANIRARLLARAQDDLNDEELSLIDVPSWHPRNRPAVSALGVLDPSGLADIHAIGGPEAMESAANALGQVPPQAKFFIQPGKSQVTVKFDPPVSGKYLMLKLFSPYKDGNIDMKYVAVHGFAGPRYFPRCELR